MLRNIFSFLFFFCGITVSYAQVSYGGTPYSFGSDFRATKLAEEALPAIGLPALQLQNLPEEARDCFALATETNINPKQHGLWQDLPTGERIWRVQINTQGGVYGMRVFFDQFYLPEGARLFLYSPNRQILLGAFTPKNNKSHSAFATTLVESPNIIVECILPAGKAGELALRINRIDQAHRDITPVKKRDKTGFGSSGGCNLNINCTDLANDWRDEQHGVVRILVTNAFGSSACSGSLIGNTARDSKPYILTAFHCRRNANEFHLTLWTFDFNYEITNCNNPFVEPSRQSITGATLKAEYENSDFCLLELQENVPSSYNAYWNRWNRSGEITNKAVCIHHPSGDVKKFTLDSDANKSTSYYDDQPNDGTHFKQIWNNGTTEGGSSGSPLFDEDGNIIGQLHGGDALCSRPDDADWFGKFSVSWTGGGTSETRLSDWLDPANTGVMVLSYNPLPNFKPYPNPTKRTVQIGYEKATWGGQKIEVFLYDAAGKLAYRGNANLPKGGNSFGFSLPALPAGLYLMKINTEKGVFVEKLIIEK